MTIILEELTVHACQPHALCCPGKGRRTGVDVLAVFGLQPRRVLLCQATQLAAAESLCCAQQDPVYMADWTSVSARAAGGRAVL